jgi:hypothetical protein
MTKELQFVIQRFPAHQMRIAELYVKDADFRQLCNDYCLSLGMLDAFRKTEPDYRKIEEDYKQVTEELKNEILHFFENKN